MNNELKKVTEELLNVKKSFDNLTTHFSEVINKIDKIDRIENAIQKKAELEKLKNNIASGSLE